MAKDFYGMKIQGDRLAIKAFRKLPLKLQRKVFRQAARKAGRPVLASAKASAPVGKTGKLKAKLRMRAIKFKKSKSIVGVFIRTGTKAEMGIPSDSKWYYPALVEFGYIKSRGFFRSAQHVPAKSYLRSAAESNRSSSQRMLQVEIMRGIDRESNAMPKLKVTV